MFIIYHLCGIESHPQVFPIVLEPLCHIGIPPGQPHIEWVVEWAIICEEAHLSGNNVKEVIYM